MDDELNATDPADDDPDLDTDANPHGSATDAIVAFTRACGVADLLRLCEALPSGSYMDIPAAGTFLDDDEAQPYRYAVVARASDEKW